ncbi:zinc finger, C2H2 type [Ancylostoma ceylanicum]|uniref:Zinc finger, C2H2 type n=1 Tax=Ancylostoma ceylanicum TaxID=53326 RepID=A0A0D6M1T4_9BILA|nr:zinc finger, C2H2 type [Ancylostoma ceylanicum]
MWKRIEGERKEFDITGPAPDRRDLPHRTSSHASWSAKMNGTASQSASSVSIASFGANSSNSPSDVVENASNPVTACLNNQTGSGSSIDGLPDRALIHCAPDEATNERTSSNISRCQEELREMKMEAIKAREKRNEERRLARSEPERAHLDGVGSTVSNLRGERNEDDYKKERIVLDSRGGGAVVIPTSVQSTLDLDLPPLPPRPTDPAEIRKIVRSKMIRCKVCGNRFGQRNLLERHLRDKHHVEYLEYLYQEELEVQRQREEELERNRIDELTSGGFIPPQSAIESNVYDVDVEAYVLMRSPVLSRIIPLPGELSNGVVARFDANGYLRQPKRTFRKKVSPQCPFCDKRFRNEVSLKKHFVKKHPECVEFVQCLDCFKCLPDKSHLAEHECDMTWLCYECSPIQNMCTEQRFTNHRAKFHRGANSGFRCNECNQKFLTPRKLRKHRKMSHVFVKTYSCHFCEELFTSEVSVMTHERIHTGIIKFECKICDFRCNRYIQMENHKKEDHGYLCSICQESFGEWAEIKNHTLSKHGGYLTSDTYTGYIESPRVWALFKGD